MNIIRAYISAITKAYIRAVVPGKGEGNGGGNIPEIEGVTIGVQHWATSNLEMAATPMGNSIPEVTDDEVWASSPTLYSDAYTAATGTEAEKVYAGLKASAMWCHYNNDPAVGATYGKLYNWYAAKLLQTDIDAYNAENPTTPWGWKVPTHEEWTMLTDYLTNNGYGYEGSGDDIAKSMASQCGWNTYSTPGTPGNDPASNNSSGFSGLPGGNRYNNGNFYGIGGTGYWWSSTEDSTDFAWYLALYYYSTDVLRDTTTRGNGFSVRLIKPYSGR